jgi:hypothetical protein
MKLNIEIRPKEWLWIALFVIVLCLVAKGHVDQAVEIISRFLIKK